MDVGAAVLFQAHKNCVDDVGRAVDVEDIICVHQAWYVCRRRGGRRLVCPTCYAHTNFRSAQERRRDGCDSDLHVEVPREASVDLRERIAATRWPQSDAVQFATIRGGEGKLGEESDKTVRPFVERGRDKAAVERLLAESFVAAFAADVQFTVKDSKK